MMPFKFNQINMVNINREIKCPKITLLNILIKVVKPQDLKHGISSKVKCYIELKMYCLRLLKN